MNNAVLAVNNLLQTSPAPQSTKSDTPKNPFPSMETEPETQNPQTPEPSAQPSRTDNIKPGSAKNPENKPSHPTDVSGPQKEPQAEKTADPAETDQPVTGQFEVAQSALNLDVVSEVVANPAIELQKPPIDETAITGDRAAINTSQGQTEINPGIAETTTTQAQQPPQPQLLDQTASPQSPQDQMPQSLAEQHVKTAPELNPSAITPDAPKGPEQAMAELLTPVAKETTVPTDIIASAAKPQPNDSQPQLLALNGEKTGLAQEQLSQQGQANLARDSAGRDMMQQQVPAEQAQQVRKENPGNALGLEIEHVVSQNDAQPQVTHLIAQPSATAPNNAEAPSPPVELPSPAQQIIESIHSTLSRDMATRQITIHLNPPELGKVSVEFAQHEGQITGLLKVASLQTRHEIEQALPEIVKNLEMAGVQVKRVEVVLTDQAQQEAFREHAHDHNPFAQHEFAQGRGAPGEPANPWLRSEDFDAAGSESQMVVTDHSINILI